MQASPPTPFSTLRDFPRSEVRFDEALARAWTLSAWIGLNSPHQNTLRGFSSLLVALLHGDDPLQRWWLRHCQAVGVDLPTLYGGLNFRPAQLRDYRRRDAAGELPEGREPVSASLRELIDNAVGLANDRSRVTGGPPDQLEPADLIVAYLLRAPGVHPGQMRQWGFDPFRDVSALLRAALREEGPANPREPADQQRIDEIVAHFTGLLGQAPDLTSPEPPSPMLISDYAADTPDGHDQLGIDDDVQAMAALICARAVAPPLSIGLFGDWGSGKSFFIRKLQARVAELSATARQRPELQRALPFYKHVVQIEFNAWNYAEGNLWAALVQHILENLRLGRQDDAADVERRRRKLQQQMQLERELRRAAVRRKREARQALAAQERLRSRREAALQRQFGRLRKVSALDVVQQVRLDAAVLRPLDQLRDSLGLDAVAGDAQSVLAAVAGTRAQLQRGVAVLAHVPADQRLRWGLAAAGVLLGPPLLALGTGWLLQHAAAELRSVGAWAAWASASLGAVAAWLRRANRWAGAQLGALEKLQQQAQQAIDERQARRQRALALIEQRIVQARGEVEAATQQAQQAREQVARIQAELDGTTPASVLADFIEQRVASGDYRRLLGLPAMIRQDFARISTMVRQENERLQAMQQLAEEAVGQASRINRIVLYIDDLDRCSEARVIEVLQAVHLLLAFELFVVVVAVDARWITRSLARRYPGLLTDEGSSAGGAGAEGGQRGMAGEGGPVGAHASPNDYLEKIFQVPLWLRPPPAVAVQRMLRALAGAPPRADGGAAGRPPPGASLGTGAAARRIAPAPPRSLASRALGLEIGEDEVARIEALVPLLGHSPRAIKRFVNVYRLFKASLSPDALDELLADDPGSERDPPYATVLLLLALNNGQRAAARLLQQRWLACGLGLDEDELRSLPWGRLLPEPPPARPKRSGTATDEASPPPVAPEFAPLVAWLAARHESAWPLAEAGPLGRWMTAVARYSYQGIDAGGFRAPVTPG